MTEITMHLLAVRTIKEKGKDLMMWGNEEIIIELFVTAKKEKQLKCPSRAE
jgi:hypothetical protein